MLNAIVKTSIRFRGIVIALCAVLLLFGLYRLTSARYDVFPEFAPPQVTVQTEAPGLSPEQVEILVTLPVETAINGVAGIDIIRSQSIQGLSVVTVTFRPTMDIYRARQVLAEQLATLPTSLPTGVHAPAMTALVSSTGDLLTIGFIPAPRTTGTPSITLMELRSIIDWTVRPRLKAVGGVAQASIFGGEIRQWQVQVHPEKLLHYNVSMNDVLSAAQRATGVRGAGFIDTPNQRLIVHAEAQALTAAELATTLLIQGSGAGVTTSVTLGDLATITDAPAPAISAASVGGVPAVVMNVWGQYGANTVETTRAVETALDELTPGLIAQGVTVVPHLFRAANFIDVAMHNITTALVIGVVLVVLILFLFLLHMRTALISCTAIPLSLLTAVIVLDMLGLTLNTMTLGGLAIAIGEVVDDAVIDVENILRRLRDNAALPQPVSVLRVIYRASLEVRSAVVYATLAVVLVFIPVLTLPGLSGRIFQPLGISYIIAVMASLGVALTLTPALCAVLIRRHELDTREGRLVQSLKTHYQRLLRVVECSQRRVTAGAIALILCGIIALPFLRSSFLPDFREGHYVLHMTMVPGTSLQESLRMGNRLSVALLATPYVRSVAQRVGRASSDDTFGPHSSEFEVDLQSADGHSAADAETGIRDILQSFPGATFEMNTFLTERIEETIGGYTAAVVINIFGIDLDVLDATAHDVARVVSQLPDAVDVKMQSPPGTPQMEIRVHHDALARWGLTAVDVLDTISTAYQGTVVGQIYDRDRVYDMNVLLAEPQRTTVQTLGDLRFKNADGVYVPLRDIATIQETAGRYVILHESVRRVQTVTCNVDHGNVSAFVQAARTALHADITLPPGTYIDIGGEAATTAHAHRALLIHSVLAGIGIILLLTLVMRRTRNLFLVLLNLPFALVGGVAAAFLTGGDVSIGSLVGFVTLFGITLRNSIMMMCHFEHLVMNEGKAWGLATALQGASERLVPVLMTALITAFGLIPLALKSGQPGVEIEGPMALVILGGLCTSTALNLFVLPMLALHYGEFETRKEVACAE